MTRWWKSTGRRTKEARFLRSVTPYKRWPNRLPFRPCSRTKRVIKEVAHQRRQPCALGARPWRGISQHIRRQARIRFCRKVAFSRVWESVSHCIPDTRFLDFAQKSHFATEPWYAVGGVHLGPVEKLLCCRKLAISSVCNMTGHPPALHRTGPACLCITGSTP